MHVSRKKIRFNWSVESMFLGRTGLDLACRQSLWLPFFLTALCALHAPLRRGSANADSHISRISKSTSWQHLFMQSDSAVSTSLYWVIWSKRYTVPHLISFLAWTFFCFHYKPWQLNQTSWSPTSKTSRKLYLFSPPARWPWWALTSEPPWRGRRWRRRRRRRRRRAA